MKYHNSFMSYKLVPFPFWIILGGAFIIFGLLLAFYKVNNQPFIAVAQNWLTFKLKGKLYIWERSKPVLVHKTITPEQPKAPEKIIDEKTVTDLAQNLDILDSYRQ